MNPAITNELALAAFVIFSDAWLRAQSPSEEAPPHTVRADELARALCDAAATLDGVVVPMLRDTLAAHDSDTADTEEATGTQARKLTNYYIDKVDYDIAAKYGRPWASLDVLAAITADAFKLRACARELHALFVLPALGRRFRTEGESTRPRVPGELLATWGDREDLMHLLRTAVSVLRLLGCRDVGLPLERLWNGSVLDAFANGGYDWPLRNIYIACFQATS